MLYNFKPHNILKTYSNHFCNNIYLIIWCQENLQLLLTTNSDKYKNDPLFEKHHKNEI